MLLALLLVLLLASPGVLTSMVRKLTLLQASS
jgi:hypothetical protein